MTKPRIVLASRSIERQRLEREINLAIQRALGDAPYSPAWDASVAAVEDLERQLVRTLQPQRELQPA